MGELSQSCEIRRAFTNTKMFDVNNSANEHELSQPFTGGAFEIIVEIFQHKLIERGLIHEELEKLA
ncbi:hypothetical protein [Bacillus mycoides]|uniref:Uncharacterized protein n=1 Tax=Bacillus mycoides TaxID=1405 RepID=A0A1W6AHI9_BACMY|nr:hypothetical protein [Bacillus mycoides]ARJ25317.1 hypothetical protein B7492_29920 [Bacillus mycoides]TKI85441.1 hypothetical protein FC701_10045 [Bacillus mycoides]